MIDSQGNRLYLMHASSVTLSSTGIKVRYGPLYLTSIGRIRKIIYLASATSSNLQVRLQDSAGNNLTNAIPLPVGTANKALYYDLKPTDFTSVSAKEVKKGDVIIINVTTAGSGSGYIGLLID